MSLPKLESELLPMPVVMTYSAGNQLATYQGQAVRFDGDGNLVWGPVKGSMGELKFDSRNRLVEAGGVRYSYDAENQRIGVDQSRYVVNSQPALSQVLVSEERGVRTFYVYGLGLIGEEREGGIVLIILMCVGVRWRCRMSRGRWWSGLGMGRMGRW